MFAFLLRLVGVLAMRLILSTLYFFIKSLSAATRRKVAMVLKQFRER
jgi:hypothetical protein